MSRLGRHSAEREGGTLSSVGTIGRFALVRTRARARWLANGFRWLGKVAHKKQRNAWHASRRSAESLKNLLINAMKGIYRAVRRPARTASRRQAHLAERWRFYRTEWSIEREIETIVNRDRLLVAGPWLSEVGRNAVLGAIPPLAQGGVSCGPESHRRRVARRSGLVVSGRRLSLRRDLG